MRRNVVFVIAISIFFICEKKIATAFLAHVTSRSKLSAICHQRSRLSSTSGDWSPHKSLGGAKAQELAVEEAAKQNAIKVVDAKKEEGDARLKAMMAAAAAEVEEAEAAQVELQLTAASRQEEEVKKAAVTKKQEKANLGAMMMAAAADVAEADASAKKIADSKKVEEEEKLAAAVRMEEEVRLAAVAMEAAAEMAELEAAESAKQSATIRQQEERQLELSRLAAVASIADAQEKAEKLEKELASSSGNSASAINSNPIQLQDMLLSKNKTPLESAISAEVVSSAISPSNAQEAADVFDIMQASAEAEAAQGSGVDGKLEIAITILAKAPLPRLRRLIQKYQPSLLPPDYSSKSSSLEDTAMNSHLKAALEALWSNSNGSWEQLMKLLNEELGKQAEESSQWMKASLIAASELSETRLKALIRTHGGIDSMPKMRNGSTEKMDKTVYVAALVDVLRENNENDYSKVAPILQAETAKLGGKKGFSSK